jgi:hypothetical protein
MKTIDFKRVLTQLLFLVLASIVAGEVFALVLIGSSGMVNLIAWPIIAFVFLFIGWACTGFGGSKKEAKKTLEKGIEENHFSEYSTFESSSSYTVIDEYGRVGFVSTHNPKEFQLAMPNEITNAKSSHINGALGGTNYVYFAFTYKGKETKIPTFTSDHMHTLDNPMVLEGISKADVYADLIKNGARKVG